MLKPRYHPKQRKHFEQLIWIGAALLALVSLAGLAGRLHWILDLFSHFRVQYVQLALVLAGLCLWVRLNKAALAIIAIALLNYAYVYPLYLEKPGAPTEKPVRAMLMNLNAGNGNTELVFDEIARFFPDILLLEEITPKWASELEVLNTTYPYRITAPQEDCFGIMLLSKYPLAHGKVVQIGTAGVPSIVAEVHSPQGVVAIIGTHPVPPIGSRGSKLRNEQLMALPSTVMEQKHPVLLIGDLNVTPFSYWFRRVVSETGLKNSMKGFGFQPSWPVNMRLLRIPLDHILHSPEITIHNRMVGGGVGSDHFPVIVDFTLGK